MNASFFNHKYLEEAVNLAKEHKEKLHTIPEKAMEEWETTAYIRGAVSNYPLEIIDLGMETGLLCYLDAGKDNCIALRADIDALPTDAGVRHLCGHDAHAASLLGAMHYMCSIKDELRYDVAFIFQPAEEGTQGAKAMIKAGLFDKLPKEPKYLFGIHNWPHENCGEVVVHRGALMSQKSSFRINIIGKSGHSSVPHKCIDPIVAAATFINSMQTIISRNTDPFADALCAVNSVRAGSPETPAPDSALITGYVRSFDAKVHDRMIERINTMAEGITSAYECGCNVEIIPNVPAVYNSDEMYEIAWKAAEAAVGAEHIKDTRPSLASEDFAVLGEHIPSFFYWVGSGVSGEDNHAWHDENFRVGENYFDTSVPLLIATALI